MELSFIMGSGIRRVFIDGRKITIVSAELGFQPLEFNLDELSSEKTKKAMSKQKLSAEEKKTLRQLAKLGSEEDIAKDIIKDFQKQGWRCVKKKDGTS